MLICEDCAPKGFYHLTVRFSVPTSIKWKHSVHKNTEFVPRTRSRVPFFPTPLRWVACFHFPLVCNLFVKAREQRLQDSHCLQFCHVNLSTQSIFSRCLCRCLRLWLEFLFLKVEPDEGFVIQIMTLRNLVPFKTPHQLRSLLLDLLEMIRWYDFMANLLQDFFAGCKVGLVQLFWELDIDFWQGRLWSWDFIHSFEGKSVTCVLYIWHWASDAAKTTLSFCKRLLSRWHAQINKALWLEVSAERSR